MPQAETICRKKMRSANEIQAVNKGNKYSFLSYDNKLLYQFQVNDLSIIPHFYSVRISDNRLGYVRGIPELKIAQNNEVYFIPYFRFNHVLHVTRILRIERKLSLSFI